VTFLALAFWSKGYDGPHQRWVDAYVGDIFIVACLFYLLSLICPLWRTVIKFLIISGIAVAVESFQATGIPASWRLPEPFVFILGSSFDPLDFLFYGTGLLMVVIIDKGILKRS